MNQEAEQLLMEFPCTFPLKVMGLNKDNYPAFVLATAQKHIMGLDQSCLKTRLSKSEKYVAVTITFLAHSKQQIDNIYLELHANKRTKMAI
ncbi:MAG: DUF493 domain-containing protein [Pseudomonadota bacterium]